MFPGSTVSEAIISAIDLFFPVAGRKRLPDCD